MILMQKLIWCDQCGNLINENEDGCEIYFLDLPNDRYLFCSEDCRDNYLKEECFSEGYVYPNGKIERED